MCSTHRRFLFWKPNQRELPRASVQDIAKPPLAFCSLPFSVTLAEDSCCARAEVAGRGREGLCPKGQAEREGWREDTEEEGQRAGL